MGLETSVEADVCKADAEPGHQACYGGLVKHIEQGARVDTLFMHTMFANQVKTFPEFSLIPIYASGRNSVTFAELTKPTDQATRKNH